MHKIYAKNLIHIDKSCQSTIEFIRAHSDWNIDLSTNRAAPVSVGIAGMYSLHNHCIFSGQFKIIGLELVSS